jgi:DNA-directed RNA polymerase specialized sigma24 family protein
MRDDSALITAARDGVERAYALLFRRHQRRARREARKLVDDGVHAQEVVAAGFAATFLAIRKGSGPQRMFRAYLLHAVRVAADRLHSTTDAGHAGPTADGTPVVLPIDIFGTGADPAVRDAFRTLPTQWQEALWRTEIEGVSASALAADLAISTRMAEALLLRARLGFGAAYLRSAVGPEPHAWASERLELLHEGALDPRTRDLVELHLEQCPTCRSGVGVAADAAAAVRLPAAPVAVILLAGGAVAPAPALATAPAPVVTTLVRLRQTRERARGRLTTRVATVAATAVAIVGTLVAVALSARAPSDAPTATDARRSPPTVNAAQDGAEGVAAPGRAPRFASPDGSPTTTSVVPATSTTQAVVASSIAIPAPTDETSSTDVRPPDTTTVEPDVAGSSAAVEAPLGPAPAHPAPSSVPNATPSVVPTEVPAAEVTSTSTPESTPPDGEHPQPPPPTTAAAVGGGPASTAAGSESAASSTTPSTRVPTTTTRTTRPATPTTKPTPAKPKPAPTTTSPPPPPAPPAATTTTPPAAPPPAAATTTTVARAGAPSTTTAAAPVYGGTLSLNRNGASSRTAAVLANTSGGLPAGTTLTFTFSDDDPRWTVRFTSINLCVGLPASVTGNSNDSLTVRCLIPELARGRTASVTFVVDDPAHNGNDNDAVRARVVAQRPGGPVATQCDGPGC